MPIALLVALAASLGIHVAALFGTDFEMTTAGEPDAPPIVAELRPLPKPLALPPPVLEAAHKAEPTLSQKARKPRRALAAAPPVEVASAAPPPAAVPAPAPIEAP